MPSRVLGPNRTHGCISTYRCGCHCPECRRASREHRARYRTRTRTYQERMCPFCGDWFLALGHHEPLCQGLA